MRLTAAARRGALTPALPMPYPLLDNAGLRLRRGQVSLTVAAPGVGKSMFWLNFAARMEVPTLYWSADTDQHDVLMRTLALYSGYTAAEVEAGYVDGSAEAKQFYTNQLARASGIDWVFDSAIPAQRVAERLSAFAEVNGVWPQLVVLDNLSNAVQHQAESLSEQQEFIVEVKRLAQDTRAHFAVLAHAAAEFDGGTRPVPQSGILNKLSKLPEVILTLHRASEDGSVVGLNIVKNRGGKPDPSALHPVLFPVDYSRAFVGGFTA